MKKHLIDVKVRIDRAGAIICILMLSGIYLPCYAKPPRIDTRTEYLKVVFSSEGSPVLTSGCVSVRERKYADSRWWSTTEKGPTSGVEAVLINVLKAFNRKDHESLLQLSDPLSRSPAIFDRQAVAFFQQFGSLTVTDISESIQIDSLILFFLTVQANGNVRKVPLTFKKAGADVFWFLPYPPSSLEYEVALAWFTTKGIDGQIEKLSCSATDLHKAVYRVSVSVDPLPDPQDRSYFQFAGSRIGTSSSSASLNNVVQSAFDRLKSTLSNYDGSTTLESLNFNGARRLKEWWSTANAEERKNYISAISSQKAFFIFDLNPLVVVFARNASEEPRVLYFLPNSSGSLVWTNSSYGSSFDRIFKTGPLFLASTETPPFRTLLTRGLGN